MCLARVTQARRLTSVGASRAREGPLVVVSRKRALGEHLVQWLLLESRDIYEISFVHTSGWRKAMCKSRIHSEIQSRWSIVPVGSSVLWHQRARDLWHQRASERVKPNYVSHQGLFTSLNVFQCNALSTYLFLSKSKNCKKTSGISTAAGGASLGKPL